MTGTGGSDRLTFREAASQSGDGVGALYDNVKLVAAGTSSTGTLSATSDADRSLALMTQYSAPSFTQPSSSGSVMTQPDSTTLNQTLAQQHM